MMRLLQRPSFHMGMMTILGLLLVLLPSQGRKLSERAEARLRFLRESRTEVVLEDASKTLVPSPETESLRQVLRIIDQHYVQRERLQPAKMLRAGFDALQRTWGGLEYSHTAASGVERVRSGRFTLQLCFTGEPSTPVFCKGNNGPTPADSLPLSGFQKQKQLSAKPLNPGADSSLDRTPLGVGRKTSGSNVPGLFADSLPAATENPLVRIGNRVFFTTQLPSMGLRYVEFVGRPLLTEFARFQGVPLAKVLHVFLNGMLDELDPHSGFLSPEEYRELRSGTRGHFGGVGLVIDEVQELPVVREIVPNSPAHMVGIEPGDILLRVGEKIVSFLPIDSILREIREMTVETPTPVWLFRPSSRRVFRVFLAREEIPTRSVDTKVVLNRPDILHLRVTGFSSHTAEDIYSAYEAAMKNAKGRLRLFVLDLRGNPGGLLDQAIHVCDLFLKHGKIVATRTRADEQVEYASRGQKIDLPMVVLVNSSSASASEIVVGALRDQNRALIVGERTFGKGSVQSLFELSGGPALKLTIAHYFTPSGKSIQSLGVEPHVRVRLVQLKEDVLWMSGSSEPEREEHLAFHLENPRTQVSPQLAGARSFEDGKSPVIWAHTRHPLAKVEGLDGLNFSYPTFENTDALTDLEDDAVARVAVSLADEMLVSTGRVLAHDDAIVPFAKGIEKIEGNMLRSMFASEASHQKFPAVFASAADSFFHTGEPVKMAIGPQSEEAAGLRSPLREAVHPVVAGLQKLIAKPLMSDRELNACCAFEEYAFQVSEALVQEPFKSTVHAFVAMRVEDAHEGAVIWAPVVLKRQNVGQWRGVFKMPPVFRAYLSGLSGSKNNYVSFYFKAKLAEKGAYIGTLPVGSRAVTEQRSLLPLHVSVSHYSGSRLASSAPIVGPATGGRGSVSGAGSAVEHAKIHVRIPGAGLPKQDKFELLLVPLVDRRSGIRADSVALQFVSTGDLLGEYDLVFRKGASRSLAFDGIVGGILRSNTGEVYGKWPLFFMRDGHLETLHDLKASSLASPLGSEGESGVPTAKAQPASPSADAVGGAPQGNPRHLPSVPKVK